MRIVDELLIMGAIDPESDSEGSLPHYRRDRINKQIIEAQIEFDKKWSTGAENLYYPYKTCTAEAVLAQKNETNKKNKEMGEKLTNNNEKNKELTVIHWNLQRGSRERKN